MSGAKRISEGIWEKVKASIALTLIEDGVTSSPNVEAYADQLGDSDVTSSRARHELEIWFAAGWLVRWETSGCWYYRLSIEGIEQNVISRF